MTIALIVFLASIVIPLLKTSSFWRFSSRSCACTAVGRLDGSLGYSPAVSSLRAPSDPPASAASVAIEA